MHQNDIDFFVPFDPAALQRFYGLPPQNEGEFWSLFENRVIPLFNAFCAIYLGKDELVVVSRSKYNYSDQVYNWKGIDEVVDLQFKCDHLAQTVSRTKFQLIILNSFPHGTYQSWNAHAVANFDIDIVQNYIEIGVNLKPAVHFVDITTQHSLLNTGSFSYTVLPGANFLNALFRIKKYLKRGFRMAALSFDPRVTLSNQKYWLGSFRSLFAHFWATRKLVMALKRENRLDSDYQIMEDFASNPQIGLLIQEFVWKRPTQYEFDTIRHNQFRSERIRIQE